ncbi:MAG: serine/threonine-protein phosphatase [Anaerolineaceae bacterium]|nr:serine/threonine-protein phosphatase [Anaerolineaceae bacterium]
MEIQIAVSKTNKFGSEISGDTLEVVERPSGGYSVVLCDGQTSGSQAKTISSLAVHKVTGLIAEGIRDSDAARAASDHLYSVYHGKVSAYLDILSADLESNTLIVSRNNPTALYITRHNHTETLSGSSTPIGKTHGTNPEVSEIPIESGITVIMSTDGFLNAGKSFEENFEIPLLMESLLDMQQPTAKSIADMLLSHALMLDQQRPQDDMSVVVLRVQPKSRDDIRRLTVNLPIKTSVTTTNADY